MYFCRMISTNPLFIENTDSTNKLLKNLLIEHPDLPDGFTVYTDFQQAGRGQGANRWQSENKKNVLASMLFKPKYVPARQFILNQCFALAVRSAVARYVSDVKIKWPNDIYVGDRKIAGILIEHFVEGDTLKNTIAGVGINVNQTIFAPELPNPTSMKLLLNQNFEVKQILNELIYECQSYKCSYNINFQGINNDYLDHLYHFETYCRYEIKGEQKVAKIIGTDEYGRLLLEDKAGVCYCCGMKEVRLCLK